jgi:HD-GYP domain-containing protein (c-di-GMP phosphodiesterase class II)
MRPGGKRFSLHIYISTLFLALLFGFAAVAIGVQYTRTKSMLLSSAAELFQRIGQAAKSEIEGITKPAQLTARLLSRSRLMAASSTSERLAFVPLLIQAIDGGNSLSSAYVGYQSGDFYSIRTIALGARWARSIQAPAGSVYLVQSLSRDIEGLRSGRFLFFDKTGRILADRAVPNYVFDPRDRPWYKLATAREGVARTDPYLFFTTRQVGMTVSQRGIDGNSVAGVDVTLDELSHLLARSRPSPSAVLVVVNQGGDVIASSTSDQPLVVDEIGRPRLSQIKDLQQPVFKSMVGTVHRDADTSMTAEIGNETWQVYRSQLTSEGAWIDLIVAAPQSELLAGANAIRHNMLLVCLAALGIAIPIALTASKLISQSLDRLTAEAREISALRFDKPFDVRSPVVEVDRLAHAMGSMKSTISRLLTIGAALGGEKRFDLLMSKIVAEMVSVSDSRGCIVYLEEPDGSLVGALARFDGRQLAGFPPPTLRRGVNDDHPAMQASLSGASVEVTVTPEQVERWYPGFEYRQHFAVIALPLKNRQSDLVGVLMLSQDPEKSHEAARADMIAFVEAVSGTAAVAIETNRLILEQKRLVQGIIELVAGAIDSKSPYTGGHCQRVPALTEMLAQAAAASETGRFKDFALSDEQWEELHIAGWLHDCGKVTSPEYVIDKATKLETIYDRLHEVRMRFEVIKREAEVACWCEIEAGRLTGAARATRLEALERLWRELDEEFAFVATCNVGGEFMSPDRIERLKRIAARRWTRTLDDRIGLSHEETERKLRNPAAALPVEEPLLSDRPEHVIPRGERDKLAPDNPWGFKIKVPDNLYNRGELYNLSVGRGTLSEEERFKINEHMIETIKMLAKLPLPRHMRNVLEIAGGHHEKMDGTGYPRRLRREDMSIPARMMAIADIFEALTAADRPYKKAKTLSESIAIMAKMRDDAHIDAELFDLFLESGVYRQYAEQFLRPEQIDEVQVARFLSPVQVDVRAAV